MDPRDLSMRKDILPVLRVASLGHAMLAFVNGEFVGKHVHILLYEYIISIQQNLGRTLLLKNIFIVQLKVIHICLANSANCF